jgi:hypothetical protein
VIKENDPDDDTATREAMMNHPRVRTFNQAKWDNSVYSLAVARSAYGAAVIKRTTMSEHDKLVKEIILIAGGLGTRKRGEQSGVLSTIELFDPNNCTQSQICSHQLHEARYSCGSFAVTNNIMCVLGGKSHHNSYLKSVELVSTTSAKLLPPNIFSLPYEMSCFGVAVVGGKVFLFGGKTKDNTLDSVFRADLSHFIKASESEEFSSDCENIIWKQVGRLGTKAKTAPRHSFSLVVDREVCWLVGGFDGQTLLNSVGIYHTKYNKFVFHPSTLSVPRSGLTSFALGKNIVAIGGISIESSTSRLESNNDFVSNKSVIAELLVRDDNESGKEVFIPMPNFNCSQKDQTVFQIGYRMYAIGKYNFMTKEPLRTIPCMNLINLRQAFLTDEKVDGIVTPQDFPLPIIPTLPAEPKMSPDIEKLTQSIRQWKAQIEIKTNEYSTSVQEAESNSQTLHDELVGLWKVEITKTHENLKSSNPEKQNERDEDVLNSKINTLRLEFERKVEELEQELDNRVKQRNKEYELLRVEEEERIQNLETTITEYGTRLQQHRDQLEHELSDWINATNLDVTNMEGIISGIKPSSKKVNEIDPVDLVVDRNKIHRVYTGLDVEPVMVSKEYGRQCTNNYDVKNQIGVGGFGTVYQGNDVSLRCTFAFKRVSMTADDPEKIKGVLQSFQREISVCFCFICN